jgi:hypothetical protein
MKGGSSLTSSGDIFGDGLWGDRVPALLIQDNALVIAAEEAIPLVIIFGRLGDFYSSLCPQECVVIDKLLNLSGSRERERDGGSANLIEPL